MALEVWLNYKDEKGEAKRVLVEGEKFAIGRTPDNDLQIPLTNLSRKHVEIQRFADVFVVSDCGSSNGTALNEENLEKPVALKNGDKLILGEALEIEIEFVSDKPEAKGAGGTGGAAASDGTEKAGTGSAGAAVASTGSTANSTANTGADNTDKGGIPFAFFLLAPALGLLVLFIAGAIFLIAGGGGGTNIVKNENNYTYVTPDEDETPTPDNENKNTPNKNEISTPTPVDNTTAPGNANSGGNSSTTTVTPEPTVETNVSPKTAGETEKIFSASASFLRRIANDQRAFLTDKQIGIVSSKINQFKGSAALAENFRNAKKNASQITELANSKNLKPQFLANAALTKLGNQRGDVAAAAREIMDSLASINQTFGGDSADACILIVAAYSSNTSGESLQTTAGVLTKNFQHVSPRTIRSLWFFKENGKLNDAQFDFALRFLAIGTITQNPKDFNVQAEALVF
jgi:predicted component of type VI protein secretion system